MGNHFEQLPQDNSLVRAIHTTVKGRARYKIGGLYQEEALKRFLEFRLSKEEIIAQVRVNYLTGNVLVIFHPNVSSNAIALLLQNIVLDYRKETRKLSVKATDISAALEETAKNSAIKRSNLNQLAASTQEQKIAPWSKNQNITESAILHQNSMQKKLDQAGSQLVLASSVIGILVLSTVLLHRYGLDKAILLAIQKLHTPLLDRIMLGITSLGDPIVLLSLSLGLGIGSLFYQRRSEATTLGAAVVGAISLNCWLKLLFGRARPALWERLIDVGLHSFPSGHAMVSIATYGFLGYSLAKQFPQRQRQIFALSAILIGAIGFSRLYLGVHWPTDVVAGYAVGLAWLIACILGIQTSVARTVWQQEPTLAIVPRAV
jgi:undecaprenyl-diphosphatase